MTVRPIVTCGSRVSRAPPHHTLPVFLNLLDIWSKISYILLIQIFRLSGNRLQRCVGVDVFGSPTTRIAFIDAFKSIFSPGHNDFPSPKVLARSNRIYNRHGMLYGISCLWPVFYAKILLYGRLRYTTVCRFLSCYFSGKNTKIL